MDFEVSNDHNELASLARDIVTQHVAGAGAPCFDQKLWHDLGKAGVLSAALPESVGGAGLGFLEQCGVLIELGRTLAPAPYLASIVLGASAIATFGTPQQQDRWAVPAARGDILLTAALPDPSVGGGAPGRRRGGAGGLGPPGPYRGGRGAQSARSKPCRRRRGRTRCWCRRAGPGISWRPATMG
jgi:alkylation response protein AidB-like acyl-CoA dehydrogenase